MSDLKFTLRFDAENKQFIGQVNQAGSAVHQLGGKANAAQAKLQNLSTQSNQTTAHLGSLRNQVLGLATGFSALFAAQQAADTLARYQDIRTQITALVGSHQAWMETEQYLNQVAQEHNKVMTDLSGTYARLLALENGGLITHEQTVALFEGMSNAASANGASNEQLGQVMYGLQQAMASGTVRAEEFNQVTEPMPDLLIKMAKAADTTVGGLRNMVNTGQMTSAMFGDLLVSALDEYDGAAARTADNINAKYAQMTRAYEQVVVAFEAPISDSFSTVLDTSSAALTLFADNADMVTALVEVSLVTALARGTTAVLTMTSAKLQDIGATRAKVQANLAELRSQEVKLLADVRELEVMRASNNQKFRAIGAESTLTAKRSQLTATTHALTTAQSRLNVVARAGAGAMGLLGGPLGVAMMAAGALAYFAKEAYDAQNPAKNLKEDVNSLVGEFQSLNQQGQSVLLTNLGSEASAARSALISTQVEIRKVKQELEEASSPSLSALKQTQLSQLEHEAKAFQAAVEGANQKFNALLKNSTEDHWQTPPEPKKDDPEVDLKLEEHANKLLANLAKLNALYGETREVAKLKYELEHGALKGINDELARKLLLEAESLDKKRAEDAPKETSAIEAFYEESDQLQTAYLQRLSMQASLESQAVTQEKAAYTERSILLSQSFQAAYDQAIGNQQLMDALEAEYFSNREALRAEHEMNLTDIAREAQEQRAQYQQKVAMDSLNFTQQQLSITTSFLRDAGEEQSGIYRALFAIQKMAAIPSMIISTEEAATKALTLGPVAGPIAAASVRAMGYASVGIVTGQALAGQAHDGINRVPRENEGTWLLKANEMVLNPTQADSFRWMVDLMQEMQASQRALSPAAANNAYAMAEMLSQLKTAQAAASTAAYGSAVSGGMPITINVQGVNKSQIQARAQVRDGQLQVDMLIEQAADLALKRLYEDADNGGAISTRIKQG
ncbi:tape measure protein [Vibrio nigripulchritudo]|uniref:tape measure protein n=1 Tax=Vibrio nigripulchritudo TaxID=28173 RepID=UPI0003B22FB9|nr:tape measure protein [Vibrio nigripulchritudo]CCN69790.1 putative Adventurous-gliding motility protein Z [Vibrio nigripulchritudo SFn118]